MNNSKLLIQSNLDIIRKLDFIKRDSLDNASYENFIKFIQQIDKNKNIVFLLNSLDEINVRPWINYLIENGFNVFGVVRINFSKWYFVKLDNINFDIEFFKNRYQPIAKKKDYLKELDYEYLFMPATLFNKNLEIIDDETSMNERFIVNDNKSIKIGYSYSIQCVNSEQFDTNKIIKLKTIITDKYIIE